MSLYFWAMYGLMQTTGSTFQHTNNEQVIINYNAHTTHCYTFIRVELEEASFTDLCILYMQECAN
jgi:hypothetical protein